MATKFPLGSTDSLSGPGAPLRPIRPSPSLAQGAGFEEFVDAARRRAIDCLARQRLLEQRAADGHRIGIQASLSMSRDGSNSMDLAQVRTGMIVDGEPGEVFADDPNAAMWQAIIADIQERLGFPLEPEFFSNMLFVAYLGHLRDADVNTVAAGLLETYRDRHMFGLYNFFASMRFACDTDCTGVAMRGRLVLGDVDPRTDEGAAALRATTSRLLKSAAVTDVSAADNQTHGKDNGPLRKSVFKVYLDDHEVQGALFDRGLKQDAVVVCHALYSVLFEIAWGRRRLDEPIELLEYVAGSTEPRRGGDTVANIIAANVGFVRAKFASNAWRHGTRYYPAANALLCFASELAAAYPVLFEAAGVTELLRDALHRLRADDEPDTALGFSLRAIAAQNLGIKSTPELAGLIQLQHEDGTFARFGTLYAMPSPERAVHFGSHPQTLAFATRALSRSDQPTPVTAPTPAGAAAMERLTRRLGETR